jgi:hypothetical protein
VFTGAVVLLLFCCAQSSPSLGGDGLVLDATSSPAISIGVEKGSLGIYAGAGFRWTKDDSFTDPGSQFFEPIDTSSSVVVVIPALTLRWLNDWGAIPGYLLLRAEKSVAVSASASGYDSFSAYPYSDSAREELLKSQNSPWSISGGLGVRAPLTERLALGGEFGVGYYFRESVLDSESYKSDYSSHTVSTFFRLTMFVYL